MGRESIYKYEKFDDYFILLCCTSNILLTAFTYFQFVSKYQNFCHFIIKHVLLNLI